MLIYNYLEKTLLEKYEELLIAMRDVKMAYEMLIATLRTALRGFIKIIKKSTQKIYFTMIYMILLVVMTVRKNQSLKWTVTMYM